MTTELVELVFDKIPDNLLNILVANIIQSSNILEISHSELGKIADLHNDQDFIQHLKSGPNPASIFITSTWASIGKVKIRQPLIRLLRFEQTNEVSIIFSNNDIDKIDSKNIIMSLALGAKHLSQISHSDDYYCGYEPATDQKTRFFSKDTIGPLNKI
jgi:hypothetical protein